MISRRKFLKFMIGLTVGVTGATVGLQLYAEWWFRQIPPNANRAPVDTDDPLPDITVDTLTAVVEPLFLFTTVPVERYRSYIQWRGRYVSAYHDHYVSVAEYLNQRSTSADGTVFADLELQQRRGLILPDIQACVASPAEGFTPDDGMSYLIVDLFEYFLSTDAYLLMGYEGFPGQARGREAYQNPIT